MKVKIERNLPAAPLRQEGMTSLEVTGTDGGQFGIWLPREAVITSTATEVLVDGVKVFPV